MIPHGAVWLVLGAGSSLVYNITLIIPHRAVRLTTETSLIEEHVERASASNAL